MFLDDNILVKIPPVDKLHQDWENYKYLAEIFLRFPKFSDPCYGLVI